MNHIRINEFAKDVKDRVRSDTPPFFRRVRLCAKFILLISGGLTAGVGTVISFGVEVPLWVIIVPAVITSMSTAIIGAVSTTTSDKEILSRTSNKN